VESRRSLNLCRPYWLWCGLHANLCEVCVQEFFGAWGTRGRSSRLCSSSRILGVGWGLRTTQGRAEHGHCPDTSKISGRPPKNQARCRFSGTKAVLPVFVHPGWIDHGWTTLGRDTVSCTPSAGFERVSGSVRAWYRANTGGASGSLAAFVPGSPYRIQPNSRAFAFAALRA